MKTALLILGTLLTCAFHSAAALVFNEPFAYPDGVLTTVASGVWSNHSGTALQVDVSGGKVNLTQTESEDVNALLSGGPYNSGTLYASFVVNFTGLPSGAGAYFLHLKDSASGFRARVYTTTNGAAPGTYRLGVANAASATPTTLIARDLATNANYLVVMRYEAGPTVATTLWIEPSSEASLADRADATDSTTSLPIVAVALRQSLSSGAGMGTLTVDDLKVGTTFADVSSGGDPRLNPPTISFIADQRGSAGAAIGPVSFTVNDGETAPAALTLSASSSNTALVPAANVTFGGSGTNRTVTITPVAGQEGSAQITVTVTDGDNNTAHRDFLVTIGAPTISPIAEVITSMNTTSETIGFTVGDAESPASSLTLSVTSTNESVIPVSGIVLGGGASNRTVRITPAAGQAGVSLVTITVSDGANAASSSFLVTVARRTGLDLNEPFNYADGSIITNSSFTWNVHSAATGQTGQTEVVNSALILSSAQSEDIHTFLANSPYEPAAGWVLYSSFTVTFTNRPTGANGDYFAHFRDASSGFRARIFATTNGAPANQLRLGIANGATASSAVVPVNLQTGVTYTVVSRYNVSTASSTLWVNPEAEAAAGAHATDSTSPITVFTYAFRQSVGIGAMLIDNLKVGTSFGDVYVAPVVFRLQIVQQGNQMKVLYPTAAAASGLVLESTSDLASGNWQAVSESPNVEGSNKVVTFSSTSGNRYFRLRKP